MQNEIPLLVGLLLVAVMTGYSACRIDADITARSADLLAESGTSWAETGVSGRWVTVDGIAPSEESVASTIEQLREMYGVTRVRSNATLADVADADVDTVRQTMAINGMQWIELERQDRTLRMAGIADTDSTRERAGTVAESLWQYGPVLNQIMVPENPSQQAALSCRQAIYAQLERSPVEFASGRSTVSAEGRRVLRTIASVLRRCADANIFIEAHSDSSGDPASNLTLSEQRAASVRDYLIARGIEEERLGSVGFGDTRPIASNLTEEGRATNRRVEFRIRV